MKIGHYVLILLCGLTGCHVPQKTEAHSPAKEMGIPGSNHPTETYHIDEPGVYTLVGPRACLETGIEIHCHNVTIDLNGHTLQGPGKDSGENYGIKTNNHQNITIRNGTVRDFGDRGIVDRGTEQPTGYKRIIDIQALHNGKCGICIGGPANLVQDCICAENGATGICPGYRSTVTGNLCHANTSNGIHPGRGSIIKENTLTENGRFGIEAFCGTLITDNCIYMNNTSQDPNVAGLKLMNGCVVSNNVIRDNQLCNLIITGSGNLVQDNAITATQAPGIGIRTLTNDNTFESNTLQGNREALIKYEVED